MTRIISICSLLLLATSVSAQFIGTPPDQNGSIGVSEYGIHANGVNQQVSGAATWYCTWDEDNIYFAISGTDANEAMLIYLDIDPVIPVNGGTVANGSVGWNFDYDRSQFHHPIRSDFVFYGKNGYHEFRRADGSGQWGIPAANSLNVGIDVVSPTNVFEVRIPWAFVTGPGNGRPQSFNWFGTKTYNFGDGANGTYSPIPATNPTVPLNAGAGANNQLFYTDYYTVINTDNATSTAPFSALSFTYHEDKSAPITGGYIMGTATYLDVTVNDNSADNSDNDPGNDAYDNQGSANRLLINGTLTVNRNLVVWQGSALLPANTNAAITKKIVMNGSNGQIHNRGRIDCNPEAANVGDYDLRRLDFDIEGSITYESSPLFKDRARFSNIFINAGKSFRGPTAGQAQIELQYGTLTNAGILDFSDGSNTLEVSTRGDFVTVNDYYLENINTNARMTFHDLLIGRNASVLHPADDAGVVEIEVKGDFSNFHELRANGVNSQLNIVMNGTGRQEIIGNVNETVGQRTRFAGLIIDNDNGLGNNNAGADVHFSTLGGGQVKYFVDELLHIKSGDLVTRDRNDPTLVHDFIIRSPDVLDNSGAASDVGGDPSTCIEGPVWVKTEVANDIIVYPLGKSGSMRYLIVSPYEQVFQQDSIQAEMWANDPTNLNNTLPTTPEVIQSISTLHWYRLIGTDPFAHDSIKVTVTYNPTGSGDGVDDPAALRVLRAPIGGNGAWENVTPLRGAFNAGAGGHRTDALTTFGDFVLGTISNDVLPVELLSWTAKRVGETVALEWSTASEIDNDHFRIERSADGSEWELIGRVEGAGNSSVVIDYTHVDMAPLSGMNYYRLMQVDHDGTETDEGVRSVLFSGDNDIGLRLWPNPTTDLLYVELPESLSSEQYVLFDSSGRMVTSGRFLSEGVQRLHMPVAAGVYTLSVGQAGTHGRYRVVKNR